MVIKIRCDLVKETKDYYYFNIPDEVEIPEGSKFAFVVLE